jgi:hypothetical protein
MGSNWNSYYFVVSIQWECSVSGIIYLWFLMCIRHRFLFIWHLLYPNSKVQESVIKKAHKIGSRNPLFHLHSMYHVAHWVVYISLKLEAVAKTIVWSNFMKTRLLTCIPILGHPKNNNILMGNEITLSKNSKMENCCSSTSFTKGLAIRH